MADLINKLLKLTNRNDKRKFGTVSGSTIQAGAGNDALEITQLQSSTINLSIGNDALLVTGATSTSTIALGNGRNKAKFIGEMTDSTVIGGTGVDVVEIVSASNSTFNLGAGNDVMTIVSDQAKDTTIDGGAGTDTINFKGVEAFFGFLVYQAPNHWTIYTLNDGLSNRIELWNIETLRFSDNVSLALSDGKLRYTGSTKDDILTLSMPSDPPITVDLNAGSGNDLIYSQLSVMATINGGAGEDTYDCGTPSYVKELQLSNGAWAVVGVDTKATNYLVSIEKVSIGPIDYALKSTGAVISSRTSANFYGTKANDTIIGSTDNDLYFVGVGNDVFDLRTGGKDKIFFDFNYISSVTSNITVNGFRNSEDLIDWTNFSRGKFVTVADQTKTDSAGFLIGTMQLGWYENSSSKIPLAQVNVTFTA